MFFDGASRTGPTSKIITGVGVVFVSPENYVLPRAFSLTKFCSNNVAEWLSWNLHTKIKNFRT